MTCLAQRASDQVSVILPHYDDLPNLIACVAALGAQTVEPGEIIVVDNGSPCGLSAIEAAVARLAPRVRVILEAERGAGPARNAGVAASRGAILAFADGDVRPDPDWLDRGRQAVAATPVVGGRVDVVARDPADPSAIEIWDAMFGFDAESFLRRGGHLLTGNLFVRRDVFEQVGGFRNGVPEDYDWCRRAVLAGHQLTYDPALVVAHPALRDWPRLAARWRRLTGEQFRLGRERRFGMGVYWLRSFAVLASILPHGARIWLSPKVPFWRKPAVAMLLWRVRTLRFLEAQRLVIGAMTGSKI